MEQQTNTQGQVGLAGLQQRGSGAVVGSKNMEQYFNLAKKMSDGQLADILAGKNMSVPQFVAMTEAMGRKQLRQAMQGAQAQQQAQQPSVKDQLLAEEAGLAALPAPNMASMDMAGGGIIAFNGEDTSLVEQQRKDQEDLIDTAKKLGVSVADVLAMVPRAGAGILNAGPIRSMRAAGANIPYIPDVAGGDFSSMTPFYDKYVRSADKKAPAPSAAETLAFTETPSTYVNPTPDLGERKTVGASGAGGAGSKAAPEPARAAFERRANPFSGITAEQVDYAKLKEQGLGEGLLRLAGGILSKPGAAGYGAGMAALGEQAGLTRKEIAGLKKEARDYEFNIKKAEEAYNQGQDELAFKYQQQADLNRYHMGMLNKPDAGIAMLNALKNPQNMEVWQQMNLARRPTDVVSRKDALKEYNDDPRLKRQFPDFETYYQTINNQLLSATIPGKGATTRPY